MAKLLVERYPEVHVTYWEPRLALTTKLGRFGGQLCFKQGDVVVNPANFDVVWNRAGYVAAMNDLNGSFPGVDQPLLRQSHITACLYRELQAGDDKLWLNPPVPRAEADRRIAVNKFGPMAGFVTPRTLMSNHPEAIARFLEQCEGGIVAKSFGLARFGGPMQETRRFKPEHLAFKDALGLTPVVYQQLVAAKKQLRVVVFGRNVFAGLSELPSDLLDIRKLWLLNSKSIVRYDLSDDLKAKCLALKNHLRLNVVVLDVGLTEAGEAVLFDVNPTGLFSLLQEMDPTIPATDAFLDFIASADANFEYGVL